MMGVLFSKLNWMMGKFTGKPDQFDGKNPWVSGSDFPLNQ
jgi:hypothetical protein